MTKDLLSMDGVWAQHAQQIQLILIADLLKHPEIVGEINARNVAKVLAETSKMHAGELFNVLEKKTEENEK